MNDWWQYQENDDAWQQQQREEAEKAALEDQEEQFVKAMQKITLLEKLRHARKDSQ